MNREKILFLSHEFTTFIRQDESLLGKHFDLKVFTLKSCHTIPKALLSYFRVLCWLWRNIRWCDGLFLRFADVYGFFFSLFARLFRKKLFVVVGGFDATWIPDLGHGTYHKKRSRFFTEFTFKSAHKILPVSKSLVKGSDDNFGMGRRVEGILNLYPIINPQKIIVVPNGYRTEFFKADPENPKSAEILTVGNIRSHINFRLKGIDVFVALAARNPAMTFTLVGADPSQLSQWTDIPPNLNIVSYVEQDGLLEFYQRAKIFMCLSLTGGMPNVLSEAMLCECVPMGYRVSGIPDIIGDAGILIDDNDIDQIQSGLEKALGMSGKPARQRILARFPVEQREQALSEIIRAEIKV